MEALREARTGEEEAAAAAGVRKCILAIPSPFFTPSLAGMVWYGPIGDITLTVRQKYGYGSDGIGPQRA